MVTSHKLFYLNIYFNVTENGKKKKEEEIGNP